MPTVALLSCPRWEDLHLADLPERVDAILIDGLEDPDEYPRIASAVRMMTRKRVIGAVEALPEIRRALALAPHNGPVADDLIHSLARSFLKFADLPAIKALANARPFPIEPCEHEPTNRPRFRVAYAQDEAFGGYFPDTLETLEALGADLVEFSPLKSEDLPKAVDLVMIIAVSRPVRRSPGGQRIRLLPLRSRTSTEGDGSTPKEEAPPTSAGRCGSPAGTSPGSASSRSTPS